MSNMTSLSTDEVRSEERRRLHLNDITDDIPGDGQSVGAELRAARLGRNETIASVATLLCIRRHHLEALEEGRHDRMPGRAYAIGFIRSYAEYLGLDAARIVTRYKAEADADAHGEPLNFPEPRWEARLPKGMLLIAGLLVVGAIYGGWLLSTPAENMVSEWTSPVADEAVPEGDELALPESGDNGVSRMAAASLPGDTASAATHPAGSAGVKAPAAAPPAPPLESASGDVAETTADGAGDAQQVAMLEETVAPMMPPLPDGVVYGAENGDGRVLVRVRKDESWMRIEDAAGDVLIEQTLQRGDSYHVPNKPGLILVARDASAFELLLDQRSLGLAGPPTLVLTGKSLDPQDLAVSVE